MRDVVIAGVKIGVGHPPFIIAEMSANHNHSLKRALQIVDHAAKAGVSALKIQTYTADTMTIDINKREFMIKEPDSLWRGYSLYRLYKEAYTPWEWHKIIFDRCRKRGIIGFSTPFDESGVDFLESLKVPCYKISSFENTDLPLILKVAKTGKPLFISTGMATKREIYDMVSVARKGGCPGVVLLKCTSSYPANPKDSNIRTIPAMRKDFCCQVGLSDHTLGIGAAVASIALGACVIEKHFTVSRSHGGVDSVFSLEPGEMQSLVLASRKAWLSLGKIAYGPTKPEERSLLLRRSLYAVKDIEKGEKCTRENIRSIRPGLGLPPKYLDEVIGKIVKKRIIRGTPLRWSLFVS